MISSIWLRGLVQKIKISKIEDEFSVFITNMTPNLEAIRHSDRIIDGLPTEFEMGVKWKPEGLDLYTKMAV